MMKHICLFTFICISVFAKSQMQPLGLSGENSITLNGERFKQQKIVFTKASGDWYSTGKDGHGTIEFSAPYQGRSVIINIEWDGGNDPHLVTDEIRHNGKRQGEFTITMQDKDVYGDGLNAYTSGDDEVKISIGKIDDMNVSGRITGDITQGREKVKVDAAFNLKKTLPSKKITNSSYKDCDNVIHDKLIGAEGRSPSECEAKYDLDVRTAIHDAVAAAINNLQNNGWEVQHQTDLSPLFVVGRGSEKDIFKTDYEISMQAAQTSAVYAEYQKKFADFSEKIKGGKKEDVEAFMNFSREMNAGIKAEINFFVNNHGMSFGNFKGGAKITKLPSGIYKIESSYVQARTGGGEDASVDAIFLLIGNWKQPVVKNLGEGEQSVEAAAVLNPALSHLAAQNILIRIECNHTLADQVIKDLDVQKLKSLLQ